MGDEPLAGEAGSGSVGLAREAATRQKGYPTYTPAEVPKADVIIALGVRPDSTYTPSVEMMWNLGTAVSLFQAERAPLLLLCGGYTQGHIAEAEMMKLVAQAMGVPARAIVMDNGSHDTKENAKNTAFIAGRAGYRSAILVAQPGHIQRAANEFVMAAAVAVLYPVAAEKGEPPFLLSDGAVTSKTSCDAVVVHGVSEGFDFASDPLAISPGMTASIAAAAGFYKQGLAPKVLLFHDLAAWGHVKRTEAMTIVASAMGIPESAITTSSSRRYEPERQSLAKLCKAARVRNVLAIVPYVLEPQALAIQEEYGAAGVAVEFLWVGGPQGTP
jgi:hypothetical protein